MEKIKKDWWDSVYEIKVGDINSDSIRLVSNEDVDRLITLAKAEERKQIVEEIDRISNELGELDWTRLKYQLTK